MNIQVFYSPPENHLAVIYIDRFGRERFRRFVTEKEQILLSPRWLTDLYLLKEVNLGPRTAHIFLSDIFTADQVPLELELKVFYRFDPRNTVPENLVQVLKSPDKAFEGIIRTNTEEKVRNEVFIRKTASHLFTHAGRRELRKILSSFVSERVKNFGLAVNPSFGVAIMNLQPTNAQVVALKEEAAAESQGRAVSKRLSASTQNLNEMTVVELAQLLNMHLASTITKTGIIPAHVYNHSTVEDQAPEQGLYKRDRVPKGPRPIVPSQKGKLPLAE